jgi:hypothetical protein
MRQAEEVGRSRTGREAGGLPVGRRSGRAIEKKIIETKIEKR